MPSQPYENRCAELLKDELSQLLAALQQGFAVLGNLGGAATPVARSQVALEHLQTVHDGERDGTRLPRRALVASGAEGGETEQ